MSSTVLDYDACVARIEAMNPGFFQTISTAFNMDAIDNDGEMPAVYAYPGYVDANMVGDGGTKQKLHDTLILDVVCSVADLRTAVGHLRSFFLGWEMDADHGPFTLAWTGHMQGQACGPQDIKGGVIHWQERYQNSTHTQRIHN